jgi:hypothetical protein
MSLEYERGKCSGVGLVHGKFDVQAVRETCIDHQGHG